MRGDESTVIEGVSDSEVLVVDTETGMSFTLRDYGLRFSRIEELVRDLYRQYDLDDSDLSFGDSDNFADEDDFLWPIYVIDEARDSQGYCDLFAARPKEQALFLFEQLMEVY